jgi:hypothetical protein
VTVLLVILLAVVLLATFGPSQGSAGPASKRARAALKRKSSSAYWLLGAVLLGLVLLRFGVNWIVVVAGIVAALLRGLLPLLRLLPLVESARRVAGASWGSGAAGPSHGGRAASGSSGSSAGGWRRPERMTRQEALQVFGLDENATREDVQREYRRLMRQVHPDLGGSSYLAAKINEAKDVLS